MFAPRVSLRSTILFAAAQATESVAFMHNRVRNRFEPIEFLSWTNILSWMVTSGFLVYCVAGSTTIGWHAPISPRQANRVSNGGRNSFGQLRCDAEQVGNFVCRALCVTKLKVSNGVRSPFDLILHSST